MKVWLGGRVGILKIPEFSYEVDCRYTQLSNVLTGRRGFGLISRIGARFSVYPREGKFEPLSQQMRLLEPRSCNTGETEIEACLSTVRTESCQTPH